MAKKSKKRSNAKTAHPALAKGIFYLVLVLAVVVGGSAALIALDRYVCSREIACRPVPYSVEWVETPDWMPASLARDLLADLAPNGLAFDDPNLCRETYRRAMRSPWIAEAPQVRRARLSAEKGAVYVRARFRQPVAKIAYQGRTYLTDVEGVVLPLGQMPRWAVRNTDVEVSYFLHRDAAPQPGEAVRIHYVVIEGLEQPAPAVGAVWPGADLAQGLRLVRLVGTRPYANQIAVVDVRNHARRISKSEPELRMYAQQGQGRPTDIRFGRFPHPDGGDWVISPARKIKYLDDYVTDQNGRLAGVHSYIDVRFDELRVSLN